MSATSRSKDTTGGAEFQINGLDYVEVATDYYNSDMYENETQAQEYVFDEILPVFNAVPKVVNIATALAVGGDLEVYSQNQDFVKEFLKVINFEEEKAYISRDLILGKSVLVKVYEELEPQYEVFSDIPYRISAYPSSDYKIISVDGEIIYAELTGVDYLEEDGEFSSAEVTEYFIKGESSAYSYKVDADGNEVDKVTYTENKLPLVEFNTSYDLKQLMYATDKYNELEAFQRNIFKLAGEPMLVATGVDRMTTEQADSLNEDNYKKQKYFSTRNTEARINLIEITGSSAKVMQEKQEALIENIVKDYPEYSIAEVLSGSNISEETSRIRMTEVLARVNELRHALEKGFNDIISMALYLQGDEEDGEHILLGDMTDFSINDNMESLVLALQNQLISRDSAMNKMKKWYKGRDVDGELERLTSNDTGLPEFVTPATSTGEMMDAMGGTTSNTATSGTGGTNNE